MEVKAEKLKSLDSIDTVEEYKLAHEIFDKEHFKPQKFCGAYSKEYK